MGSEWGYSCSLGDVVMPSGIQVFDGNGVSLLDTNSRITRLFSEHNLGDSNEAFIGVSGMTPDNSFLVSNLSTIPGGAGQGPFFRVENGGFRYRSTRGIAFKVTTYRY